MKKLNRVFRFLVHNLILLKKYNFTGNAIPNSLVYHIDGSRLNMGLADRFRQVLGVYALAKKHNKIFKFKMTAPFDIEEYLEPRSYNWKIHDQFLSFNIFKTRLLYIGYFSKIYTEKFVSKSKKQVYLYSSTHFSWVSDFGYSYKELFHELFKPSEKINQIVANYIAEYQGWDTLHFRFIGLLGDFNERNVNILTEIEKYKLVAKCKKFVIEYLEKHKKNTFVCSGSVTFLNEIKEMPGIITVPGTPKHLDFNVGIHDKDFHKEFLDFFLISQSDSILSVSTREMYRSDFPVFAAAINDVPFSRVQI
ncbi:hypothetical protein [Cyclobacterium xiamenense]|uniref:hypothetical protein n=1 Tax=Cyclobacterium xiamenense TaxID=1297121 RepID=UPI0012B9A507|nr:hypothetical protein [Cyclobacterium xiamenense]